MKTNWVYCLKTHNDTFKIGGSCDILTRLGAYKGDNRPKMVVYTQVLCEFREAERDVREQFIKSGRFVQSDGSEWFKTNKELTFLEQDDLHEFILDVFSSVSHLETFTHTELKILEVDENADRHCKCGSGMEYWNEDIYGCSRCGYTSY